MTRAERELRGVEHSMAEHGAKAQEILKAADAEDRDPTEAEQADVQENLRAVNDLKARKADLEAAIATEKEAADIGKKLAVVDESKAVPAEQPRAKSIGEQFTASDGYKRVVEKGLSGSWRTGMIPLGGKATLVEGDNLFLTGGTPGEGSPLVPIDQRPGVMPILFQRLTVAGLLASATTTSNAIHYVVESVATNNAGIVPEGTDKPESALEYDYAQETVKKIATFLPVSDEMLEDAPAVQGYINSRLVLFVQQEEETQLLHGAGGSNFYGLLPRVPSANKFVSSSATQANAADHIYEALTVARRSFLEPDGIIVHPDDWAELRLLKDSNYNYIGGSPFSNTGAGEPADTLWGKRVVVTEAMLQGEALVGAFGTAAQVFRRGGLSVEASNSHDDYFVKNLTAIRAEERLALAVYRPEAFAMADLGGAS